jgi:DNA-binding transcriptional ArsR family regulator
MNKPILPIALLQQRATEVAALLSAMANPNRLLVLCHLVDGERSVNELADMIGVGQSALSQHLARLRHQGFVMTRRDGQTIYYRLADAKVQAVLAKLYELYCC